MHITLNNIYNGDEGIRENDWEKNFFLLRIVLIQGMRRLL